jgi:hypothetical protein
MSLSLQFNDYLNLMRQRSNRPFNMAASLAPFGVLGAPTHDDDFLLMGHVLDALHEGFRPQDLIGPEDVLAMAEELGFESP